jgi:hypothetical protein
VVKRLLRVYLSAGLALVAIVLLRPALYSLEPVADCRLGAGVIGLDIARYPYSDYSLGAYTNWTVWDTSGDKLPITRLIEVAQDVSNGVYLSTYQTLPLLTWQDLGWIAASRPGQIWVVGNEPELPQNGAYPEVYARIYHDVYSYLKSVDPTARLAIGGVVMPTPPRLRWLELVMKAYQDRYHQPLPVDVWNTHLYIYPDGHGWVPWPLGVPADWPAAHYDITQSLSVQTFAGLAWDLRRWLHDKGYGGLPVIVTEWGVVHPMWELNALGFDESDVSRFVSDVIDFLHKSHDLLGFAPDGGRPIQQADVFSLNGIPGQWGTILLDARSPYTRTAVGQSWIDAAAHWPASPQIQINSIGYSAGMLWADVSNAGGSAALMLPIRFDDVSTGSAAPIGEVGTGLLAGCGGSTRATVAASLSDGLHTIRVSADRAALTTTIIVGRWHLYDPFYMGSINDPTQRRGLTHPAKIGLIRPTMNGLLHPAKIGLIRGNP